jgi:hypothetical protein
MPDRPLPPDNAPVWVAIDVLQAALGLKRTQAVQVARTEGIPTTNTRPEQYSWPAVVRVYKKRQENTDAHQ